MCLLRSVSQIGRAQVAGAPSPLSGEESEACWVEKEGWCWGGVRIQVKRRRPCASVLSSAKYGGYFKCGFRQSKAIHTDVGEPGGQRSP